jgi:hypothetical protein
MKAAGVAIKHATLATTAISRQSENWKRANLIPGVIGLITLM